MAFIVIDSCINCKYTDCVEVCPVDCFYEGPNMLVIDPDQCIDCGLCEPECPVKAIISEDELTKEQLPFKDLNKHYAQKWPNLTKRKAALPQADEWAAVKDKKHLIEG